MTIRPLQVGEIKITIRATDICGVYTDQEFTVESLQCSCEGFCRLKGDSENGKSSAESECVCPKGCSGEKCTDSLPGTRSCHHGYSVINVIWLYLHPFIWNAKECCVSCLELIWMYAHPFIWSAKECYNSCVELIWLHMHPFIWSCLLYTSPSPRDKRQSRMPSSA